MARSGIRRSTGGAVCGPFQARGRARCRLYEAPERRQKLLEGWNRGNVQTCDVDVEALILEIGRARNLDAKLVTAGNATYPEPVLARRVGENARPIGVGKKP